MAGNFGKLDKEHGYLLMSLAARHKSAKHPASSDGFGIPTSIFDDNCLYLRGRQGYSREIQFNFRQRNIA
jgi:hypothetical protein